MIKNVWSIGYLAELNRLNLSEKFSNINQLKDLLLYIIKYLVDNPDDVLVNETVNNGSVNLSLQVNPQDMGKIIGKQGKIIKSIRNVVKILAVKEGKRVDIELIENSNPQHEPQSTA